MFSHILVGTNNIDQAKTFYDEVLGVLGVGQGIVQPNATGHKRVFYPHDGNVFGVSEPISGNAASNADGGTIGFVCSSPEQVKLFHHTAIEHGGTSIEDPPGLRDGPMGKIYLCYFRDLDGHKICGMHRPG